MTTQLIYRPDRPNCTSETPVPPKALYRAGGKIDLMIDGHPRYGVDVLFYTYRDDEQFPGVHFNLDDSYLDACRQAYGIDSSEPLRRTNLYHYLTGANLIKDVDTWSDFAHVLLEGLFRELMTPHEIIALDAYLRAHFHSGSITDAFAYELPGNAFTHQHNVLPQMQMPLYTMSSPTGIDDVVLSHHPHWGLPFELYAFLLNEGDPTPSQTISDVAPVSWDHNSFTSTGRLH